MFDKISVFEKRAEELNAELCMPEVAADGEKLKKIMIELKSIEPIVEAYKSLKAARESEKDALELLGTAGLEPELKELAQAELDEAKAKAEALESELKILLLPKDPNDDKNVIVEIRAGAGGEEAANIS